MPRCSNAVVCIVNFITILFAVPLISFGFWLKGEVAGQCDKNTSWFLIITGVVFLVLSLFGIIGSCCRVNFFMWIYLFFMFLLIVVVAASIVFSFTVMSRRMGYVASELKIGNSSSWIQKIVTKNWDETTKCLKESKLCDSKVLQILNKNRTTTEILKGNEIYKQLNPIQVGCCKPPRDCGFTRVNDTYWEVPKSGINATDGDCKLWSNSQNGMCYGCESCKAGMITSTRRNWKMGAYASIFVLIYLIIIYSIGCCAFRNNRADKYGYY